MYNFLNKKLLAIIFNYLLGLSKREQKKICES